MSGASRPEGGASGGGEGPATGSVRGAGPSGWPEGSAAFLWGVLAGTGDAVWKWELATDEFAWSGGEGFAPPPECRPPTIEFWRARIHPEDRARVAAGIRLALEGGGEGWSGRYRFRRADDTFTPVNDRVVIQRDDSGRAIRMAGVMRSAAGGPSGYGAGPALDVNGALLRATARSEAERTRLKQVFSAVPAVMALYTGPDHIVSFVNPAWETLVGKPGALGLPFREVFPEVTHTGLVETLDRIYESGEPYRNRETVFPLRRWGGAEVEETVWDLVWLPLKPRPGGERDILVHAVEVTEQLRARTEVERERDRTRALLESTSEGIYGIDVEGRCTFINRAAAAMLGYRADELLGRDMHALVHHRRADGTPYPASDCLVSQAVWRAQPVQSDHEVLWRRDGSSFPAEYSASPIVREGRVEGVVVTFRDVSEWSEAESLRLALYEEGRRARSEAERANLAKSQFLANMSHEIRTPINAIVGYTDLLEVGIGGALTPTQAEYVERVRASSRHLLGLVNDILDLSKVEAGEMSVSTARVRTADVTAAAVALIGPQALAKKIEVRRVDGCEGDAGFAGDEDRVRQILVNLLSNAVKFTEPGGRVALHCGTRTDAAPPGVPDGAGTWIVLEVEDSGIGIPPEALEHIFDPFAQVEGGHTRTRGGTGLGLTISRRFARLMGGDLVVRSRMDRGSCFSLWLPGEAAPAARPAPARSSDGWPSRPGEVPGLSTIGNLLARQAEPLTRSLGARLRGHGGVRGARGLDRAQREDHIATFLLDLGKSLLTLDEGGGEPALLRDGDSIQQVISVRHGEQRRRIGWTAGELVREFELLRKEVDHLLLSDPGVAESGDIDAARGILGRLIERAERLSLSAFNSSAATG